MRLTDIDINNYYMRAVQDFKESHPEWICTIKDGALIIQLNAFSRNEFNGYQLSVEERRYRHIVIIKDNGTVIDHDMFVTEENVVGLGKARISKSMFLGESGSFTYRMNLRKDTESGCREEKSGEVSECNVQKVVCEYFKSRGLIFYSPTRLWIGITFMAFPIILGIIISMIIPFLPMALFGYLAVFFLMGVYFVVTCRQAFNTLNIAGITFMGVALGFLAFWPMLPDDLFMKLIFGFFIVLFLPLGLAIFIAGYKEDKANKGK